MLPKFSEIIEEKYSEKTKKEQEDKEKRYNEILDHLLSKEGVKSITELSPEKISEVSKDAKNKLEEGFNPHKEEDTDRTKKVDFLTKEYDLKTEEVDEMSDAAIDEMMTQAKKRMIQECDSRVSLNNREEFMEYAHNFIHQKVGENYNKANADEIISKVIEQSKEDETWNDVSTLLRKSFEEEEK